MKLALFDFDGTITNADSMADFIAYSVGRRRYYMGLLAMLPMLTAYLIKVIPNDLAKERLLAHFFKHWPVTDFQEKATHYALERLDQIIRPAALERLHWHLNEGHKVVIVSASIHDWLKPWCDKTGVELIATELAAEGGLLNGRFATANCHGDEKVRRIEQYLNLADYNYIYAYGDTSGDRPMLAIAQDAHFRPWN